MANSVADYILERLTPIYGIPTGVGPDAGSVQELLKRWAAAEGIKYTGQSLFNKYVLAGAAGASLQDKAYDFWSRGLLKSGVKLPGTAGNYLSTPDSVLNSITGDIDIRVCLKMADWTPAAAMGFISKDDGSAQRSFNFRVQGSGGGNFPQLNVYQNGSSTVITPNPGAVLPFADGSVGWVRVTCDVDNGAGQNVVTFYTSVDGITWTLLGTPQTQNGVISIFNSTSPVILGMRAGTTVEPLDGTIYYAEVRNGIDGPVVVKFDSSQVQVSGAMLPATINGWTWNGTALYKRDDYVRLPGTAGNYLSFPDTAANSITGGIDLCWHGSLDDWTPAIFSILASQFITGNQAWRLSVNTGGTLSLSLSADGTATVSQNSSVATGFVDRTVNWCRATWRQSDGQVQFFTSSDGVTWVQLGSNGNIAIASIFNSTAEIALGANSGGTSNLLIGNVYYVEVRNGINGPVVASFNAADFADVQTPWTINGTGWNWEGSSFTGKPAMALSLPGTAGNYVSTPDTAGNSVVGDIDLRIKLSMDDWTPSGIQSLITKFESDVLRSFLFNVDTLGRPRFQWSTNGTATSNTVTSTASVSFTDRGIGWVRAVLVIATGQVLFYTSMDGIVWTPLGTPPAAVGATTIFDAASIIEIGTRNLGALDVLAGKVCYAEVRNGIDGPIVAKFDATNIARTGVRTPTTTVQPGGTPNLLTPNQASIETDATGWLAQVNCSVAQDATQFLDGTKSLSMTATAIGASGIGTTPSGVNGTKVIEDKLYTAICSMRAATVGRATKIVIKWYDAAGGSLGFSGNGVSTDVTTGWTVATITGVAPNGAVTAELQITVNDVLQALGEVHYVDRVSLVEAAELWSIQGSAWDLVQVA